MDTGTTIGHYTILRPLGKGGMGEVYLAEDTKLQREVALKFLPEAVRNDSGRLARFRREALAAAKLKHPNIATIYALEDLDDHMFIAMEYVEEETLTAHIPNDGMELDKFFDIFLPLADGLAHAHSQGRIHRDLKPGNIMIAADGTPKILDFGLARIIDPDSLQIAYDSDTSQAFDSQAPTQTIKTEDQGVPSLTQGGRLMGTPMYMSPEQAEREETDARTDIFSFGVVMYEALTGQRLFEGKTLESIIGRILAEEPKPVSDLKPVTPYPLWSVIRRCLRKDREHRIQTAEELHAELQDIQQEVEAGIMLVDASAVAQTVKSVPFWRQPLAVVVMVLMLIIGGGAIRLIGPGSDTATPLRKFRLPVDRLTRDIPEIPFQISPDGKMIAYLADNRLWIRDLEHLEAWEMPVTEGAHSPFWSPESDYVGYSADGQLRKISPFGGPGTPLASLPNQAYGAIWRPDGSIIASSSQLWGTGLYEIPARAGEPVIFLQPDSVRGEMNLAYPALLPHGQSPVFIVNRTDESWDMVVPDGDTLRFLLRTGPREALRYPAYAPSGHLLYTRYQNDTANPVIWALPFDPATLTVTGDPFPVAENAYAPSVSGDGTLVYATGASRYELAWIDRSGGITGTIGQSQSDAIKYLSISPDDRRVAVMEGLDIWIYDTIRGGKSRLTREAVVDIFPAWAPDGEQVAFTSFRSGNIDIWVKQATGTGEARLLVGGPEDQRFPRWSPKDDFLVFYILDPETERDLWYQPLTGDGRPEPFVKSPAQEYAPCFSPDGDYVVYVSDESGRNEIYVTDFPAGNNRWPVSVNGGILPKWAGDEIFFWEDDVLMAVPVETTPVLIPGTPKPLFRAEDVDAFLQTGSPTGNYYHYDVTSDGQRFVVVRQHDEEETPTITVVENWYAEFSDRE